MSRCPVQKFNYFDIATPECPLDAAQLSTRQDASPNQPVKRHPARPGIAVVRTIARKRKPTFTRESAVESLRIAN